MNKLKNRDFALVFLDSESGLPLSFVHEIFFDKRGDSNIISARAGEMNSNWEVFKYSVSIGDRLFELNRRQLYEYINTKKLQGLDAFFEENDFYQDWESIKNDASNLRAQRILILLDISNTESNWENCIGDWSFLKIKKGGAELISEFLLSSFCHKIEKKLFSINDLSQEIFKNPFEDKFSEDVLQDGIISLKLYTTKICNNLRHIREHFIEEDFDPDVDYYKSREQIESYYYRVNLNQVDILRGYIQTPEIPNEVSKLLTDEQNTHLSLHAHRILTNNAQFILDKVLCSHLESL